MSAMPAEPPALDRRPGIARRAAEEQRGLERGDEPDTRMGASRGSQIRSAMLSAMKSSTAMIGGQRDSPGGHHRDGVRRGLGVDRLAVTRHAPIVHGHAIARSADGARPSRGSDDDAASGREVGSRACPLGPRPHPSSARPLR